MLVWRFRILLPEYVQQEVRRRVVILHFEGTCFIYFSKHLFSSFLVHRFVNNYTNRVRCGFECAALYQITVPQRFL